VNDKIGLSKNDILEFKNGAPDSQYSETTMEYEKVSSSLPYPEEFEVKTSDFMLGTTSSKSTAIKIRI